MFSILAAFICLWFVRGRGDFPQVTIEHGTLQGTYLKTIRGRQFAAFQGIPYAKPPIGDNRFKVAVPNDPWLGVWMADRKPPMCIQLHFVLMKSPFPVVGSEDCLYINVYTPQLPSNDSVNPLDVLVFIHGGAFQFLTSVDYGPDYLLDRDIVLVTFNYRLGIIGFASLENDVLPGNNGLKDQLLALKWVKQNIAAFGGDPNKITLSGLSAGASSVHYHVLSKHSRGLFHKAIMNSGVVLNPWSITENVREKTMVLAREFGCLLNSPEEIVQCLREKPAIVLTQLIEKFRVYSYLPMSPIGPIIETPGPSAIIDKMPIDIIKNGEAADVPLLFSVTSDEGMFPGSAILVDESGTIDRDWDTIMPHILELNYTVDPQKQVEIVRKVRDYYLKGKNIREDPAGLMQLVGDRFFYNGIFETIKLHAEHYKSPVYVYRFSYVSDAHISNFDHVNHLYKGKACHADDVNCVLRFAAIPIEGNSTSMAVSRVLIDHWMNFILGTVPPYWTTVKSGLPDMTMLDISSPDETKNVIVVEPETSGQKLWKSFHILENGAKN